MFALIPCIFALLTIHDRTNAAPGVVNHSSLPQTGATRRKLQSSLYAVVLSSRCSQNTQIRSPSECESAAMALETQYTSIQMRPATSQYPPSCTLIGTTLFLFSASNLGNCSSAWQCICWQAEQAPTPPGAPPSPLSPPPMPSPLWTDLGDAYGYELVTSYVSNNGFKRTIIGREACETAARVLHLQVQSVSEQSRSNQGCIYSPRSGSLWYSHRATNVFGCSIWAKCILWLVEPPWESLPMPSGRYKPDDRTALQRAIATWCFNSHMAATMYGPIGSWDISRVTDLSEVFYRRNRDTFWDQGCSSFNDDISDWDTSHVTKLQVSR